MFREYNATLIALARASTKTADVRAVPQRLPFAGEPAIAMPLEYPKIRLGGLTDEDNPHWGRTLPLNGELEDAERRLLKTLRNDFGMRL